LGAEDEFAHPRGIRSSSHWHWDALGLNTPKSDFCRSFLLRAIRPRPWGSGITILVKCPLVFVKRSQRLLALHLRTGLTQRSRDALVAPGRFTSKYLVVYQWLTTSWPSLHQNVETTRSPLPPHIENLFDSSKFFPQFAADICRMGRTTCEEHRLWHGACF
jgi:hypothetical protein